MGWSFGWESQESIVRDLLAPMGGRTKIIDQQLEGDHLWTLHEVPPGKGTFLRPEGTRFIRMYLFEREDGEWGYKSVSEAEGPLYLDCPDRMLDLSTEGDAMAVQWRDACRAAQIAAAA